jgi:hypothetical protein
VTPLEAARRLDCLCDASEGMHSEVCVLTVRDQIVAALEAAERAINDGPYAGAYPGLGPYDPSAGCAMCGFCGEPTTRAHLKDCAWQALVAALRGEGTP